MKRVIYILLALYLFTANIYAQEGPRLSEIPEKQKPVPGQSLYIFTISMRSGRSVVLTIDDTEIGHFFNGETAEIAVEDGKHIVRAYQKKWDNRNGIWKDDDDDRLTDTLNGERFPVQVSTGPKLKGGRTSKIVYESNRPAQSAAQTSIPANGIEGAIARASGSFILEIPINSIVAVISISTNNLELATFTIDELEYRLVIAKKFTVVDRKTLDTIRSERNFQMSGEVSDQSAVSIGNMLGANIVITGSITGAGNTQRLTLKVLDVKTAQIISMAREQF
jgi:TolB-like protein